MNGWIKLFRAIKNHWIWQDPIKFQWWVDLLLSVNYEDKEIIIGNKKISCRRGECVRSLKGWAEEWHVTRDTARNFLSLLEKNGMITHENLGTTTRISIVNYDFYQISDERTTQNVDDQDLHDFSNEFDTESEQTPQQHEKNKENSNDSNDNDMLEDLEYRSVINLYNTYCPSLKPAPRLTKKRKEVIQSFLDRNGNDKFKLMNVFKRIESSPEYNGTNAKGWKADFDCVLSSKDVDRMMNDDEHTNGRKSRK